MAMSATSSATASSSTAASSTTAETSNSGREVVERGVKRRFHCLAEALDRDLAIGLIEIAARTITSVERFVGVLEENSEERSGSNWNRERSRFSARIKWTRTNLSIKSFNNSWRLTTCPSISRHDVQGGQRRTTMSGIPVSLALAMPASKSS